MTRPRIMVAPTGARRGKADHPALPVTIAEIAETAATCQAQGADALHLHVRDARGKHVLDAGLYREAIADVTLRAPGMGIQVTTEAVGQYSVADQLRLLEDLCPAEVSIAVREIARDEALAPRVYAVAQEAGTRVQHIIYDEDCLGRLVGWQAKGVVPQAFRDVLLVFGSYSPARDARPEDIAGRVREASKLGFHPMICAFGRHEEACLIEAAYHGAAMRVGFENNTLAPDGTPWASNADVVASLVRRLAQPHRQSA